MSERYLAIALGASLFGLACGGGSEQSAPAATQPPATTAAAAPEAAAPEAAGASEFGVPECDAYIEKYVACIDSKVPEEARAMIKQSLDQTKAQWEQAAATPEGKEGLAAGCQAATEAAKTAMAAYGCEF